MPTQRPLISPSDKGVSITRSGPKRFCSPTVARKTPPLTPTSSPSTTTLGSSSMARASARLTASTSVTSGTGQLLEFIALARIDMRDLGIEMVKHGFGRARACRQIALDGCCDARLTAGGEALLLFLAPRFQVHEMGLEACDRLFFPSGLDFLRRPVTSCIIGRRMVAEPVSHGLNERRPFAAASGGDGFPGCGMHGDDVVTVHLLAIKPRGDRLLGQRLGCRLQPEGHGNGPLVVVDDEHKRQFPYAREIHCLPKIAFGGRSIATKTHRHPRLLSEP